MSKIRHRDASTLSVFEHTVIEMAKGIVASEKGKGQSFDVISRHALYLANRIMERLEEETDPAPRQSSIV